MDLKLVLIVSLVWVVACLLFYRVRKRKIVVKQEGDTFSTKNVIDYPREFAITIIYQDKESVSDLQLSDLVIKYADLMSGNYKVPANLKTSKPNKEITPLTVEPVLNEQASIFQDNLDAELINDNEIDLEFEMPEPPDIEIPSNVFEEDEILLSESDLVEADNTFSIVEGRSGEEISINEPAFEDEDSKDKNSPTISISSLEDNFDPFI